MRSSDYTKIPNDFFNDSVITLLRNLENGTSIVMLWLRLLLESEDEGEGGFYEFRMKLGSVVLTDDDLKNIFNYKGNISNALLVLEKLGLIIRTDHLIIVIPYWGNSGGRNSPQYRNWRTEVLKRDNFTCQKCGKRGALHVHHIKHWADNVKYRFDVENGITLCKDCHLAEHGGSWSGKNGRTQDVF